MKYATILSGLLRFDAGTQYTLATECGLGRRNIQFLAIVSLFSKPKINSYPQIDICFLRVLDRAK